jgi:hypothetical protein
MAHLGSLGTSKPGDSITFDYFGEQITANVVTDLDYMDFMEEIGALTPDNPQSQRLVKDFARLCFGDSFDTFWRLAKDNRQSQEDVFDVLTKIVEASTGRPTVQPSGSSDGQSSTEAKSTVGSSLEERLAGRPDLQVIVGQAQAVKAS